MRIVSVLLLALSLICLSRPLEAADPGVEKRIDELLAQMTLEEKLGQMSQASLGGQLTEERQAEIRKGRWGSFLNAGPVEVKREAQRIAVEESRLGIPLIFGRDVIHGYRTVFPIPLGQSASWDPELVERAARIAAKEAAAMGIHWTFAPMIDITRDPRWGRVAETWGEDPYLASAFAASMVRGFQGDSLARRDTIAACAKHYVGYGAAEAGKDYNTTWIPEPLLRNVFLPPYDAAVKAGVASVMSAFSDLNGIPASGNAFTLRRILRDEFGFQGFVVSDWDSVVEMIQHGYAADEADAAAKGLSAGVDMEMVSTSFYDHVKELLAAGRVKQEWIDEAVRRILRVKFALGLFENPYPDTSLQASMLSEEHLAVARRLAAESVVLLKNEEHLLPLPASIGSIAVIGPLADSPRDQLGCWTMDGRPEDAVTPLAALREKLGEDRVHYAAGLATSRTTDETGIPAAVEAARRSDAVILFLGEEQALSGEARSRAFLDLPGAQEKLVAEVAEAGKPMIAVIMAGRPLTFQNVSRRVEAVMYAWHPGTMGGPAIADLLFGDAVPSGKLTITFPRTVGQVPIYYAHKNTGRPPSPDSLGIPMGTPVDPKGYTSKYLDVDFTPEYPFGYGLSYTTFSYANLRLSAENIPVGGRLTASVDVTNTGDWPGVEIVQLYTRDLVASLTRPVKELKGFRRVRLAPGETKTVSFTLTTDDLRFYDSKGRHIVEPGRFHLWIGPSSAEGLKAEFTVTGR